MLNSNLSPEQGTSPPGQALSKGWMTVIVVLFLGYLLLKPWLEETLNTPLPGFGETYVSQADAPSPSAPDVVMPAPDPEASTDVLVNVDEEPSASSPSEAPADEAVPGSPKPETSQSPEPGQLREIGKRVFVSTAGLRYKPGSADGHRLDHVLKHSEDDLSKPVHGVFTGDREAILKLIDEAYLIAQKRGPPQVKTEEEGDRTVYTIDMKKKIGYVGGQVGQRKRKPGCTKLRIVLEGTDVITAFPVDR